MFILKKRHPLPPMTNARMTIILVIVAGCFLILIPSIFFPITKNGLKSLFGIRTPDYFDENNENILPRKVEMAIKNSPKRNSDGIKKLPGRPQFYTGVNMDKMYSKLESHPAPSKLEQQVVIPIVVITLVVAYVFIKVLLNSGEEIVENTSNNLYSVNDNCKCDNDSNKNDTSYMKEAKKRDLIQSRPTYRAFQCCGDEENMKIFRDHLQQAQICKCKLNKFKKLQNQHKLLYQSEQETLTAEDKQEDKHDDRQEDEKEDRLENRQEDKEAQEKIQNDSEVVNKEENDILKDLTNHLHQHNVAISPKKVIEKEFNEEYFTDELELEESSSIKMSLKENNQEKETIDNSQCNSLKSKTSEKKTLWRCGIKYVDMKTHRIRNRKQKPKNKIN